jgi:hypothetical protein
LSRISLIAVWGDIIDLGDDGTHEERPRLAPFVDPAWRHRAVGPAYRPIGLLRAYARQEVVIDRRIATRNVGETLLATLGRQISAGT